MTIEDIYDMIRDNEKKLDKILELLEGEDYALVREKRATSNIKR